MSSARLGSRNTKRSNTSGTTPHPNPPAGSKAREDDLNVDQGAARGQRPGGFRLPPVAGPQHRKVRELRRGCQLHLHPHRHVPVVLLRLRHRGTRLSMVVADGVRRADGRRIVLHGAGRQVSRRGIGLQLVEEARQPPCRMVVGLADADRVDRDDLGGGAGLPAQSAADLERIPDRRRRHRGVRLHHQRRDPRHGADRVHHTDQRARCEVDGTGSTARACSSS